MNGSPMITGSDIYTCLREKALREQATEDEKVVYITGCPEIVKKGAIEMLAARAAKALKEAARAMNG